MKNKTTGDRNVTLKNGWNLVGYSSSTPKQQATSTKFNNSNGALEQSLNKVEQYALC
ncbi:MAG: hypothetical protein ACOCUU_01600 [Nanoarchaeota archaeon]